VRAANAHSKWEQADKMSSGVWISKEEGKKKTNRKQKAGNEEPLREQRAELEKHWKRMEMR
jgi:hypothetical protein